ncbi:MAG: cyclic diguanylate phosphodiesterase [Nitrospirae bacterium]|nr:cyclic diguanylate phosphodiesterase [Nitrospirota bacterium]
MDTVKKFISSLMIAISNSTLYSKEHELVEESARRVLSLLDELLKKKEKLEIMIIESDLVADNISVKDTGLYGGNLVKRLKRKGISRVDFLKGVTLAEISRFIKDLSDMETKPKSSPHLKTGVVSVRAKELKDIDIDLNNLPAYTSEQTEKIKHVYDNISPFKRLEISGLEEVVVGFILTFKKEANILKLLSPVKSHSEYTYTHATNVSVLSMFQAELLGIKGQLLHDIGIAALLHDVGKLFVSKDVLNKKGHLDNKEFSEISHHPLYGAKYLAKIDGLTRLAPLAAFEHHRKYDGTGYPALNINGKKQHICSQIISISDVFDALRSLRPYRSSWDMNKVLAVIKNGAGTEFNSYLAENFTRMILTATSE